MAPFLGDAFGNASSLHQEGFIARDALAKSREQIAAFLGARSEEIIFTGNGAEAVNLAIKGAAWTGQSRGRHILLSAAEHPAVTQSVAWLSQHGFESSRVPVDSEGRINPEAVRQALRDDTILACVHHANHDIGTIQQIRRIAEVTAQRGIPLFVDAIASAGWLPVNVEELQADLLAVSPHRFYGPKGVGILYRHRRARVQSLIHGGEQEEGRRAGTENVAAIVGAGVAAEFAGKELPSREAHTRQLQQQVLRGIRERIAHTRLNGPEPGPERHPAHLNLSLDFVEGEALGLMLDVRGIAVATGSACVATRQRVPPVLAAIGLPERLARGNVLLSFGRDNTGCEADHFIEALAKAVAALREMSPEWEDFQKGLIQPEL